MSHLDYGPVGKGSHGSRLDIYTVLAVIAVISLLISIGSLWWGSTVLLDTSPFAVDQKTSSSSRS